MDTLTESDLRSGYFVRGEREFMIDPDTVLTEEAKIFANRHGLKISRRDEKLIPEPPKVIHKGTISVPRPGAAPQEVRVESALPKHGKPEHMTNLNATELVPKNDPRITFRGKLDTFQADLLMVIAKCYKYNSPKLAEYLQEAVGLLRRIMAADVKNEPLGDWTFIGLTSAELREHSHHPEKYYGLRHQPPEADMRYAALELNLLRAKSREVEMAFSNAFILGHTVKRKDIAELLNRLSSGLYILYCRAVHGEFDGCCCTQAEKPGVSETVMQVPIEVSARHVHLCKADVEKLFGPGHKLTHKRDLSQTGEFLSEERVTLRGPKGEMKNVAVLGPERSATQVELSLSDAGVEIPLRLSGDLSGAADVTIISPSCELNAHACAIAALSHIHLTPEDAQEMGLKDKQLVSVDVDGDRPVTFRNVVVRVKPSFRKFMHIDFDEANAAHIGKSAAGRVRPQN